MKGAHGTVVHGADLPARRVAAATLLCALLGGILALAPPAHALYGPAAGGTGAEIVSVDNASDEQTNGSTSDAAISADGQYVVFQSDATNFFEDDGETEAEREQAEPPGTLREGGIFRYDRATGELRLVASGNLVLSEGPEAGRVLVRGAANPSVSADGRYVAFASAQQLVQRDGSCNVDVPQGTHYCNVQVYVRDMEVAPSQAGAYSLVSAQNGSEEPPVYEDGAIDPPIPGGDPGAQLWPNTAISANGEYVLFRSAEVPSSLPEGSLPVTPPDQLFVRDLRTKTTTLVTRKKQGEPEEGGPAGGAGGPATLSADGSTVAWVGKDAPAQTTFLPGESLGTSEEYYLWRRWQEPGTATRRVTGIVDPEDPECDLAEGVSESPTASGPCYGPLTYPEGRLASIGGQAPGLSADGDTVAFLAGSALRPDIAKPDALEVFLTSMSPGVTRKAGTRELTLAANGTSGDGAASIGSLALSSDGTHIAFVSQRDRYVLGEPQPLGTFSATGQQSELYVIDLTTDTLERAVLGVEAAEPNGSVVSSPTLTAEGSTVAFASSASNLILGDANGFPDAFTATYQAPAGTAAPSAGVNVLGSGFSLTAAAAAELGVSAKRGRRGEVLLLVETPGPGKLTAEAQGKLPVSTAGKASGGGGAGSRRDGATSKGKRSAGKAARPRTASAGRRPRSPTLVLARANGEAPAEGTATLTLHLAAKYLKELGRVGKLKAEVKVDFTPPAPTQALTEEVAVTFYEKAASKPAASGPSKSKTK